MAFAAASVAPAGWPAIPAALEAGKDLPPEWCAWLVVALAAGVADRLCGRYIHASFNFDELVRHAEEIVRDDRYTLRLRT